MINEIDVRGRAVGRVSLIVDGPHKQRKSADGQSILDRHTRAGDVIKVWRVGVIDKELILGNSKFTLRGTPLDGQCRLADHSTAEEESPVNDGSNDCSNEECRTGAGEHPAVAVDRLNVPGMRRVPCCRRCLLIMHGGLD